jgi:hypothetical protein
MVTRWSLVVTRCGYAASGKLGRRRRLGIQGFRSIGVNVRIVDRPPAVVACRSSNFSRVLGLSPRSVTMPAGQSFSMVTLARIEPCRLSVTTEGNRRCMVTTLVKCAPLQAQVEANTLPGQTRLRFNGQLLQPYGFFWSLSGARRSRLGCFRPVNVPPAQSNP